jgi:SAM-dependent methyltransferase
MRRPDFIARQARLPRGVFGRLIARITSYETRKINLATLDALGLRPADRVLELGCGRGRTVERAAEIVIEGQVIGVDHAEAVVHAAAWRCRRLIELGRVQLHVADSARLPFANGSFDKAYSVHTIYFWTSPIEHLREIRRVLDARGRIALGVRKKLSDGRRDSFPASVYTFYDVDEITEMLRGSGFASPQIAEPPGGVADLAVIVADADPSWRPGGPGPGAP